MSDSGQLGLETRCQPEISPPRMADGVRWKSDSENLSQYGPRDCLGRKKCIPWPVSELLQGVTCCYNNYYCVVFHSLWKSTLKWMLMWIRLNINICPPFYPNMVTPPVVYYFISSMFIQMIFSEARFCHIDVYPCRSGAFKHSSKNKNFYRLHRRMRLNQGVCIPLAVVTLMAFPVAVW